MEKEKIHVKNVKEAIDLGQSISVEILNQEHSDIYYSYVFDEDEKHFYILQPTDYLGISGFVRIGDSLIISCISKKNIRLAFDTKVIDIIKNDNKRVYKITKPVEFYKFDLRENFRVDVLINANCTFLDSSHKLISTNVSIINLSASGAKISLGLFLELNKVVSLEFALEGKNLTLPATIMRRLEIDKSTFHYGLKFDEINQKDKDLIIKFCLKKQIEILRMQRGQ